MKKCLALVLSLVTAIVFSGRASEAAVQEPVTMKLAVMVAVGTPGEISGGDFKRMVEERTNGAVTIDYYPASQLGSSDDLLEQLLTGTVDFVWNTLDWYATFQKDWNVLNLGFAISSKEQLKAFLDSERNTEIKNKLLAEQGLRILTDQGIPYPRVFISTLPVQTVEDIKGINVRVPEMAMYVKTWQAMGVNCVTIPSGDTYMGLKEGMVSGVEFPLGSIYGMKWHEVAPHITYTNHLRIPYVMSVNENSWQGKLTPETRAIIQDCAEEAARLYEQYDAKSVEERVKTMAEEGAIINETPDLESFKAKLTNTAAECEAQGLWSKGLYDYLQSLK